MKTAEEYRDEWSVDTENNTDVMDADHESLLEKFKQCQLDALKEGMRRMLKFIEPDQRQTLENTIAGLTEKDL